MYCHFIFKTLLIAPVLLIRLLEQENLSNLQINSRTHLDWTNPHCLDFLTIIKSSKLISTHPNMRVYCDTIKQCVTSELVNVLMAR